MPTRKIQYDNRLAKIRRARRPANSCSRNHQPGKIFPPSRRSKYPLTIRVITLQSGARGRSRRESFCVAACFGRRSSRGNSMAAKEKQAGLEEADAKAGDRGRSLGAQAQAAAQVDHHRGRRAGAAGRQRHGRLRLPWRQQGGEGGRRADQGSDLPRRARGAGQSRRHRTHPVSQGQDRSRASRSRADAAGANCDAAGDGRVPDLPARIAPDRPRRLGGLYRLKEELTRRVNTAISPSRINAVLFKEIVVQ